MRHCRSAMWSREPDLPPEPKGVGPPSTQERDCRMANARSKEKLLAFMASGSGSPEAICPSNVVEQRHEHDPFIEGFWILPVQVFQTHLCDFNSGNTWYYVPNELYFSGCQHEVFDKSVLVPYILQFRCPTDGSGFETPTHNIESENT